MITFLLTKITSDMQYRAWSYLDFKLIYFLADFFVKRDLFG